WRGRPARRERRQNRSCSTAARAYFQGASDRGVDRTVGPLAKGPGGEALVAFGRRSFGCWSLSGRSGGRLRCGGGGCRSFRRSGRLGRRRRGGLTCGRRGGGAGGGGWLLAGCVGIS